MISWHRFYDSATGRYISADPIGLAGGINLYAYVGGNPVNAIDPEGLASYREVESHFILGVGALEISCCTEDGQGLKHLYMKICLGAAIEASGGGGVVSNSDGKSCSNPPETMLGGELGASCPIGGAQTSVSVGTRGEGASGSAGVDTGVGIGSIGFKATACYYKLMNTIPTDKECECDNGEK